jgi:hypothetical protein
MTIRTATTSIKPELPTILRCTTRPGDNPAHDPNGVAHWTQDERLIRCTA